jgi:hypothetical protein
MSREIMQRITDYLKSGGLFNPEMANHEKVRDLLIDCRDELAKPEQEPAAWISDSPTKGNGKQLHFTKADAWKWSSNITPLYTAPTRKEWVGLTSEDWENTPDTGKQGCERDAELFDWIEQTLKDKNEPSR